jgi:hypothetical protein
MYIEVESNDAFNGYQERENTMSKLNTIILKNLCAANDNSPRLKDFRLNDKTFQSIANDNTPPSKKKFPRSRRSDFLNSVTKRQYDKAA